MRGRILEKDIERPVVKHARERGVEVIKLNLMGQIGWPDRQFFGPDRRLLLIEFKKPGEEASEYQAGIHERLRKRGHTVYVIDNVAEGIELIDMWLKAKPGAV